MTREEAITKIKRKACFGGHNNKLLCQWADEGFGKCEECENYMAIKALEQKPRKGEWISKPHVYGVTYCSECDFELKIDDTNYCPNCGAKMDKEKEEEGMVRS